MEILELKSTISETKILLVGLVADYGYQKSQ